MPGGPVFLSGTNHPWMASTEIGDPKEIGESMVRTAVRARADSASPRHVGVRILERKPI